MRIGIAAAVASALLFAASHTAEAAPLINLQDGAQAPAGMVDLVRKGGGGKGFSRGGGGKGFSRGGRGFSAKGYSGRSFKGGRGYSGRAYAGRSFKGGRGYSGRAYAGRSFKGGRSYKGGRYAYAGKGYGRGKYGRYGYKSRYYRRYSYPFFWGGIGVAGYYGSNCGWLYRQAQATGSAYWWQRYQDCLYYY